MIKQINLHDFREAFRQSYERKDVFSYGALEAIFDHYEQTEDEEHPEEMDIIATCCEFREYSNAFEAAIEHGWGDHIDQLDAEIMESEKPNNEALEWLQDRTIVLQVENFDMSIGSSVLDTPMIKSIVIAQF